MFSVFELTATAVAIPPAIPPPTITVIASAISPFMLISDVTVTTSLLRSSGDCHLRGVY